MRLAVLLAAFVFTGSASASPFGEGRSEGRPTVKKPKKAKQVAPKIEADEEDQPKAKKEPKAKKLATKAEPKKKIVDDEEIVVVEDDKPAKAKKIVEADDEAPTITIEGEDDTEAEPTETAALDEDDGEPLVDAPIAVGKTAIATQRPKTRFYFRAGAMQQQTRLGDTQFQLRTDLPLDSSGLGEGSGVELQKADIPVGAIIGVVLPVLNRKLSIETVLGIPRPTKLVATGKLANESLAPTFMNMPTGIEPLGSDIGEVTFAPPIVTAVYRVAELGRFTPVAGAGVMVLMTRGAKITNAALNEAGDPKLKITPAPGLVLQGGVDIQLWKRVAARIDVKYVLGMRVNATVEDIAVTPTAIPQLGSIEVGDALMSSKVSPLIVQAGVGLDF
jgi:outer membrane protein W